MQKLVILIIPILLIACSTCKISTSSQIKEIQFGYGGGVTQSLTRYTLKSDGKLYNGQALLLKVKKSNLKTIFEKADSLHCDEYNYPSNTFSFITIVKSDTSLHYCWSMMPPLPIMELNNELNNILPK